VQRTSRGLLYVDQWLGTSQQQRKSPHPATNQGVGSSNLSGRATFRGDASLRAPARTLPSDAVRSNVGYERGWVRHAALLREDFTMAARRFTCTSCSGTGKQRIPATRTPSERACERCGGSGVLALEDADPHEYLCQQTPPAHRPPLAVAAAASVTVAPLPATQPEMVPMAPGRQSKMEQVIPNAASPRVTNFASRPRRGAPSPKPRAKAQATGTRRNPRKSAK